MNRVVIMQGDAMEMLSTLPANSVHCCITSPPYWGLRDYGVPGQLGLEKTPEEYLEKMVSIFREVRRVLRQDGTLWLNMGDSYAGYWGNKYARKPFGEDRTPDKSTPPHKNSPDFKNCSFKPKDLIGIPWRLALALQADGWWLRSDIIWHKANPMPESVTDRPTTAHEHIFLLTKSSKYYYDAEAVKEESTGQIGMAANFQRETKDHLIPNQSAKQHRINRKPTQDNGTRNLRSVWTLATESFPEAHFATFPTSIPERCIKAGTSEKGCCPKCGAPWERVVERIAAMSKSCPKEQSAHKARGGIGVHTGTVGKSGSGRIDGSYTTLGWQPTCKCPHSEADLIPCLCLDPFSGAGTTALVAAKLGRDAIGIELSPEYVEMSRKRLKRELGFLVEVEIHLKEAS